MIISHRHRFIFIKTNKTAGTSVEIALSRFCGEDDVITQLPPKDEATRASLGGRGAQHHYAPLSTYGLRDFKNRLLHRHRKIRYYNHISGQEIREFIGADVWDGYFKFCIERNPWDRVISLYYWVNKSEPRMPISDFVASDAIRILKERGRGLYTLNGEVAADRICLFESLADDLEEVRQQIGLPDRLELPRAKASHRKDRRSYRELLSDEDRDRIAELFSEEIELFGYEF